MPLEVTGTLSKILPAETVATRNGNLTKQTFVINTEDRYPKMIAFVAFNEKTDMLKSLSPGATIKVAFEVSSREYNNKFYTDLRAWRIDTVAAGSGANDMAPAPNMSNEAPPAWDNNSFSNSTVPDDLPF